MISPGFALCARGNLTRDEVYDRLVTRGDYVMETKYDGYRAMVINHGGITEILTRNGNIRSLHHIEHAIGRVPVNDSTKSLILDGELISPGRTYNELAKDIASGSTRVVFMPFDILAKPDIRPDLTSFRYTFRRNELDTYDRYFLGGPIHRTEYLKGQEAMDLYDWSKHHNLDEGFVLKRQDSSYTRGRSNNWLRSKFTSTISVIPLDVTESGLVECSLWTGGRLPECRGGHSSGSSRRSNFDVE